MLRSHISRRELRDGDRLFQNGNGKPVCPHQLGKCWRVARRKAFGERYPNLRMQDLRHVAASVALRAGCSVVEVSERLGNSPATLMRVYAHVLAGDRERSNARIEAALRAAS